MKSCSKCKNELELNQFDICQRDPSGYDPWCRPCRRSYNRQYYRKNLEKSRQKTNTRRAARLEWLSEIKRDKPCVDCGMIYESFCMDFDHLRDKVKSVSRMVLNNTPFSVIEKEIKKCELVCVICHNNRTLARLNQNGTEKKYNKYSQRNIEIINQAKNKPCEICKKQYPPHNMQLDHINPEDKFKNVCQLKNFTVEILLIEITKCQVLCAICHRRKSILVQRNKYGSWINGIN